MIFNIISKLIRILFNDLNVSKINYLLYFFNNLLILLLNNFFLYSKILAKNIFFNIFFIYIIFSFSKILIIYFNYIFKCFKYNYIKFYIEFKIYIKNLNG